MCCHPGRQCHASNLCNALVTLPYPHAYLLTSRLLLQYQVTVVGVDKRGQRTPGSNALQFRTPASGFLRTPPSPPPVPPKSLRLISADATSPTSGTATAQPQPAGAFVKVGTFVWRGGWVGVECGWVGPRLEMHLTHAAQLLMLLRGACAVHLHAARGGMPHLRASGVQ